MSPCRHGLRVVGSRAQRSSGLRSAGRVIGVSASWGSSLSAMWGDQSLASEKFESVEQRSVGEGPAGALLVKALLVTQGGEADARELVGQRAGGLVGVRALSHAQCPGT